MYLSAPLTPAVAETFATAIAMSKILRWAIVLHSSDLRAWRGEKKKNSSALPYLSLVPVQTERLSS